MQFNSDIHHRKSIRLKEYDYSKNGYYFITICTKDRQCIFGEIFDENIVLNEFGKIVKEELLKTELVRKEIKIDYFVIIPNHLHAIIIIDNDFCKPDTPNINKKSNINVGANGHSIHKGISLATVGAIHELPLRIQRRTMTLGKIVGQMKMNSSKRINILRNTPGIPVWQRNYYEHVIRNEKDLYEIRKYIENNPLEWLNDKYYKNNFN